MANQNSYKTLNPNASPYVHITANHLHLYPYPQFLPYNASLLPSPFCTYNIRFQPSPPKSFPIPLAPPPSAKKINFSLTPVPSGPRIPKPRLRRMRMRNESNDMKWRPKYPEGKATSDAVGKVGLGFEGTRWKNSDREYEKALPLETNTTSLMIKNVPNKYTRKLLIQTLDIHCEAENRKMKNPFVSAYDFLYLPIDFNRRANAGFAFVNFTNPDAAFKFRDAFNGKRWNFFDSSKVAEISRARIQGKAALINNSKHMDFSYGSEEDMPVWFAPARDGSGQVGSKMFTVGRASWTK